MSEDMCYIHMRHEPTTDATYRVCGECWHAWQSEDEFFADVAAIMFATGLGLYVASVVLDNETCCPLCAHDF